MNPVPGRPVAATLSAVAPDAMQVRELQPADSSRWDEFVRGCSEATFFHRAGWKTVIERAFGHRATFLYAEAGGRIEGVLPLAEVRSLLFGNALVSLPFCVYGGVAAANDRARRALDESAVALAEERRVDHLEYRSLTPHHPDWAHTDLYVTFRKAIDPDPEKNLLEIPRKQRAMVRKGIKAGLTGQIDEGLERFFAAYAHSVHRLGTPVLSLRYFQTLREVFGPDCEVLTVTRDGTLVASVMSFYFRDEVLPYYGGGTEHARELAGNDFMYWELMRRACERGLRVFDYGRSKRGTGSFDFKRNWGFEPLPLHYEYRLVRGRRLPELNPLNPKYRLLIKMWQRLPLPLANWVGPLISRSLG
jgi:FemAB-related protein (PEP-CTERM system-associated)